MQYLLLIYEDESIYLGMTKDEFAARLKRFNTLRQDLVDKNIMRGGQPLEPTQTATSVRVRDGETITTDGPFAETKEQLIGFFMVECENLDEALKAAARIPVAESGTIEVRPVAQH